MTLWNHAVFQFEFNLRFELIGMQLVRQYGA